MRLISLLLTLLLVGYLIATQLGHKSQLNNEALNASDTENLSVPRVPTSPKDLPKFKEDINKYLDDSLKKKRQDIEDSLK